MTIRSTIEDILEKDIKARSDNFYLYACYLERTKAEEVGYEVINTLKRGSELKLTAFETVVRARRKIQEENPTLKPNKEAEQIRKQQEKKFNDYSKGKVEI